MSSLEKFLKIDDEDVLKSVPAPDGTVTGTVSRVGGYLYWASFKLVKKIMLGILWAIAATLRFLAKVGAAVGRFFRKAARVIFKGTIGRYRASVKTNKEEIEQAEGFFPKLGARLKLLGKIMLGKRGIAVTLFNYALPVISLTFLFNIISYAGNQNYALKVTVNGEFIGYIDDETVYADAEKIVQKRINYTGSSAGVMTFTPSYKVELAGYSSVLSTYQLADKILGLMDTKIEYGFGMYIGDEYYGTLSEQDRVNETLADILDQYRTDNPTETVTFEKDVTFTPGLYLADSFVDEDKIIKELTSYKVEPEYYTVVLGDSPAAVCAKLDMTYEELAKLNPGFSKNTFLSIGDQIKTVSEQPFLNVIVTREEVYEEEFDYDIEYVEDNESYTGFNRIRQNGENGTRVVRANVSYVNGFEIGRRILLRTTIKNSVTQIVAVGTQPLPSTAAPPTTIELGKMVWPVGGGGGYVSYWYRDPRYSNHRGIDIAAGYGTPIFAAESGVITSIVSADGAWNGGWGKAVTIQHANGLSTRYAHCSSIAKIYVGQKVLAGQLIAYVGSTGNSTGNHLHFEVMQGGVRVDPSPYLKKP